MSRVHDALRRAEMGGMMPPEEPPVVASDMATPVTPDFHPPDLPVNGVSSATSTSSRGSAQSAKAWPKRRR